MTSPSPDPGAAVADAPVPARTIGSSLQECPLVGPAPPTGANFDEKFLAWTGMPVDQSIAIYEQQTGKTLTPEEVQRMFTDPAYANQRLMADPDLHRVYRSILNTNVPPTEDMAISQGFTKLPVYASLYHNPTFNPFRNSKYVGPDGHLEAVYDGEGNPVLDSDYIGTFNFFGPGPLWSDQYNAHKAVDMDPYYKWGN